MAQQHWVLTDSALNGTTEVKGRIRIIEQLRESTDRRVEYEGVTTESIDGAETLASLLLTTVNGDGSLPVQSVTVEYLKAEHTMLLPYYIAMATTAGETSAVPILEEHALRYKKVSTTTYMILKDIVADSTGAADIRDAVDALPTPPAATPVNKWMDPEYYILDTGFLDTPGRASVIFSVLSQALLFNCDIRDTGILLREDMRMGDALWAIAKTLPIERLNVKLQAYTRQVIAALNYAPCDGSALGAWIRSYGVSSGILPSADSLTLPEYKFTAAHPVADSRTAVTKYEREFSGNMHSLSLNVLAMFGILHLNKDHTYKANDTTMTRIGISYLRTIRTMIDAATLTSLENSMEVICRTAPHPFGLGQTYAVARIMFHAQALAPALAIRINACPPGVQRCMIARAAMQEWGALTVGRLLNESLEYEKHSIEEMCATAEGNPPAFSGLWRLYGIDAKNVGTVAKEALDGVATIMPIAVGFAESQHSTSDNQRDGLALALSIANIKRDSSGLVSVYTSLWDKYFEETDNDGLQKMVEETVRIRRKMASM